MKLGLSTAAFYGKLETEDAAAHIKDFDIDCAEVFLETFSEYSVAFGKLVAQNLGPIKATSMHPMGTIFENMLFSRSAHQRADGMAIFISVLDAAQAVGATRYVFHGQYNPKGAPLNLDFASVKPRLDEMCALAAERGIRMCWENVSWCTMRHVAHVEQVRALYPQMGFTLDIKQAKTAGADPFELLDAMGGALSNVHICDHDDKGNWCLPGQGIVDFGQLFGKLETLGYDGPVILEPYSSLFDADDQLKTSLAYLRTAMIT